MLDEICVQENAPVFRDVLYLLTRRFVFTKHGEFMALEDAEEYVGSVYDYREVEWYRGYRIR